MIQILDSNLSRYLNTSIITESNSRIGYSWRLRGGILLCLNMYQLRDASLIPESSDIEKNSNSYQGCLLPQAPPEAELINTVRCMSDKMAELQREITKLSKTQNSGVVMTSDASTRVSQQPALGAINQTSTHYNQPPTENTEEEQDTWLIPRNRRSSVLESNLLGPNYNDPHLSQLLPVVSPKREPISALSKIVNNDQLQLETDLGTSQLHDSQSKPGFHQLNVVEYPTEPGNMSNNLQGCATSININPGQPLTREPLCRLPDFDGSSNLKCFRRTFYEFCQMNGYSTEREIIFWLKQCLKGRAKDILYNDCSKLSVIWSRLETRFGDHLLLQKYSVALPARKRQANESLSKLADDIRRMSDTVYFDLQQNQKERLAIMHFVNALQSPAVQYDLTQKSPKSLEEALHFASVREMFFGVENQPNKPGTSNHDIWSNNMKSGNTGIPDNHTQYQTVKRMPACINDIRNLSQPVYNMSPQSYYYNVPQPMPIVSQSGQWYGPPHTFESTQGAGPQSIMNSVPLCSSHIYSSAAAPNIGSTNVQGTRYDNQYQQNRGMGNSQPISR